MKKNNNKPTFASRAKKIMAKYPRATFDKVEKEAMEMELDALIAEQEAMKQAMGMSQPQQEIPVGEQTPMFPWGGNMDFRDLLLNDPTVSKPGAEQFYTVPEKKLANGVIVPVSTVTPSTNQNTVTPEFERFIKNMLPMENTLGMVPGGKVQLKDGTYTTPYGSGYTGGTVGGGFAFKGENKPYLLPTKGDLLKTTGKEEMTKLANRPDLVPEALTKESNPFLPSYIGAGVTALGNIAQMFMDKRPKPLNMPRYTPEEVDLTEQRLAAERAADLSRSINRTSARNSGMNAAQTMSAGMASESDINRNLSNSLLQTKLAEEQFNKEAQNRAGMINTEIGGKEAMINRQMLEDQKERQRGYLAGVLQTVPDAMKDINQIKAQLEYLKQLGLSEENALKWLSQKNPDYVLEMLGKTATGTKFNG